MYRLACSALLIATVPFGVAYMESPSRQVSFFSPLIETQRPKPLSLNLSYSEAPSVSAEPAVRKMAPIRKSTPTPSRASTGTGQPIVVSATGYCSCSKCCGPYDGTKTASGARVHWGTLAASKGWAFGTQFTIDAFPGTVFTVQDRGGAIKGDKIDIWFPSHQEALSWGRRTVVLRKIDR